MFAWLKATGNLCQFYCNILLDFAGIDKFLYKNFLEPDFVRKGGGSIYETPGVICVFFL
jgi:hypothetical protein